jgi:hypothetical protein
MIVLVFTFHSRYWLWTHVAPRQAANRIECQMLVHDAIGHSGCDMGLLRVECRKLQDLADRAAAAAADL